MTEASIGRAADILVARALERHRRRGIYFGMIQPNRDTPPPGLPRWRRDLLVDDDGCVIPQLSNVLVVMRGEPMLIDAFSFDEMQRAEMLNAPLPLAPNAAHAGLGPYPRQVRDEDVSQLQEWLQRHIPRVGVAIVHQAVHQRARERAYHPVRDELDRLKWDGKNRLDTWLTDYLGADPTAHGVPDLDRDAGGNPVIDESDDGRAAAPA